MKSIFVKSIGGLGNRLNNLVSGMILADQTSSDLYMDWPSTRYLPNDYDELFCEPNPKRFNCTSDDVLTIPRNRDHQLIINDKHISYTNATEEDTKIIKKYFAKIKPHPEVLDVINNFAKENNLENAVGIHYRYDNEWVGRSDLQGRIQQGFSFQKMMLDIVDSYAKNSVVFLSCSDQKDQALFKQFSNVKTFEKTESVHSEATPENKHRVVRTKSSLIPAIIDMYLLSRCKEIVITPASTFSECAWYLSGCSARIFHPINKVYLK